MHGELKIETLIFEARNGNKEAFHGIFELLSDRIFAYTLSRTSNREDAQDITQETFVDVWASLKKFKYRTDEEFYGFVFRIAKRKLYRHYKTGHQTVFLSENITEETYDMKIRDDAFLLEKLKELPLNHQEVLKLRYWSDMTFSEIASAMDVRETTAKVWHHRAMKKLRILLKDYDI